MISASLNAKRGKVSRVLALSAVRAFERLSFLRRLDKSLVVSEWDEPWPNE